MTAKIPASAAQLIIAEIARRWFSLLSCLVFFFFFYSFPWEGSKGGMQVQTYIHIYTPDVYTPREKICGHRRQRAIRGGRKAEPARLKARTEIGLPGTHFNIDITTGRLEWKGGFHEMKGVLKMKEKTNAGTGGDARPRKMNMASRGRRNYRAQKSGPLVEESP